jgi:hypothetical protein
LKTFLKTDYRGVVEFLRDCPELRKAIHLDHTPHLTTLQKVSRKLLRLPVSNQLLVHTARSVLKKRTVPLAAIDSTGLEAGHISRYFVRRKRSKQLPDWENTLYRRFPKLAVICDCRSHLILGVITPRDPSVDVNQFCASLKPVAENFRLQYILAEAGYDSQSNHRYSRDYCQITSIIPAKHGRPTTKLSTKKYRRPMQTDFDREKYGQRWQVETVFSMIKRCLGSVVHARSYWTQNREMLLMVLTHNLAIILLVRKLFYRAGLTLLV